MGTKFLMLLFVITPEVSGDNKLGLFNTVVSLDDLWLSFVGLAKEPFASECATHLCGRVICRILSPM